MDVIYTDSNRTDQGVLNSFNIDFDTTDTLDYEMNLGIENNILSGNDYWYVDGTEYGGIVDKLEVITSNDQIRYTGRSFRGILKTKIICPPSGEDYKIVSGNLKDVINGLLIDAGLIDLFSAAESNINVTSFQFKRYVDLYQGLVDLAFAQSKVIALKCKNGKNGTESRLDKVEISFVDRLDYSNEREFTNDDIQFRITKGFNTVNHMICLGKGELKDRLVAHLYVDGDGDIVEEQYYFGMDEVVQVYELSSEEDLEALKKQGADKLGELLNIDSIEVTISNDISLKVGDIVGGYEQVTGMQIRREITNIVAKITDDGVDFDYSVGGDDPGAAALPSEIVEEYILPIASDVELGGIKIGQTLNIKNDGTLYSEDLTSFKGTLAEAQRICA